MKPVVTWIVLANTREVRILVNRGPGKGLEPLANKHWRAEGVDKPRDKAGVGHSIAGPAVSAVDPGDPQRQSDIRFARKVAGRLSNSLDKKRFHRLVLVSGPLMLGLLRGVAEDRLKDVIVEEVAKDLTAQPIDVVKSHLGAVIAV
ncbi:host attachment protein [Roseobacter weihaiensis]|uniref:host attachment protein n=1 Tax=Roseobacter weihaiensis TaxID=2763262 RepID=UPI001D0B1B74|nr:host attachment protein [Roseobacter sp. H9]